MIHPKFKVIVRKSSFAPEHRNHIIDVYYGSTVQSIEMSKEELELVGKEITKLFAKDKTDDN